MSTISSTYPVILPILPSSKIMNNIRFKVQDTRNKSITLEYK